MSDTLYDATDRRRAGDGQWTSPPTTTSRAQPLSTPRPPISQHPSWIKSPEWTNVNPAVDPNEKSPTTPAPDLGALRDVPTRATRSSDVNTFTDAASAEQRVVDAHTGGEKGQKLARFSLIPREFLWALAEHYGRGACKYEDRNWERGYKWSLSVDALDRHLTAWLLGEDDDQETGSSHLVAVAWHAIALWWWHRHGRGTNDVRLKDQLHDHRL